MFSREWSLYSLFTVFCLVGSSVAAPTPNQWQALNATVNGRMFQSTPLALPCYSNYNGTATTPNAAQCSAVQAGYTTNSYISSFYSGFENTNWGTCQKTGQGCPLSFTNPSDASVYSGKVCYPGALSNYYIEVQEVSDIQAALKFSATYKVPLSVKNTGHDYKGRSAAPGTLALWTHNIQPALKLVKGFVPDGCPAAVGDGVTMGAGQQFDGLYKFADQNGVTVVGGASGTVGAAGGWISGGGHSAISNVFGLGVDNVLQIRTVLPNGTYVTANRCQNQDLFFALRGGGGSTFGINFEMTTKAQPKVTLQVAYVSFYSQFDPNISSEFMQLLIQNANKWASEGWGGYITPGSSSKQTQGLLMMTPLLTKAQAQASMQPVFNFAASFGYVVTGYGLDTVNSFYDMYSTYLAPTGEKVGLGTALGGRLIPASQFTGTNNQNALLNALNQVQNLITYPTRSTDTNLLSYGAPLQFLVTTPNNAGITAANDTSALHPGWRDAVWSLAINVPFSNTASTSDIKAAFTAAHSATQIMTKLLPNSGTYLNEADTFETDPVGTYWGTAKYNKLLAIKKKLDPTNLLTCWGCIGWDSTDPRYSCYPSL